MAIRHPAYLALTDGECSVPHRGVTACNDIRGTMRPDTHFFAIPILPGHPLALLLDPSPPLISAGTSPSILTGDKGAAYHYFQIQHKHTYMRSQTHLHRRPRAYNHIKNPKKNPQRIDTSEEKKNVNVLEEKKTMTEMLE